MGLTERRQNFVEAYLELGDAQRASTSVGFAIPNYGYVLLRQPNVQELVRVELDKAKTADVVLGRRVLRSIAQATDLPAGARVTAARTLLEYAGAMARAGDGAAAKDPSEMTTDELRALVDRLDRELGDRAKPVNSTQSEPLPADVLDMTA